MSKPAPKKTPKSGGKKSRVTTVTREEIDADTNDETMAGDGGEGLDDSYMDPTEEALEALFTEARGHDGVEIRVYKLDPENRSGARAYAMAVSLQDADSGRLMDILQRKWKGGEFELMARAEGRILKRTVVTVMPPPEPDHPAAPQIQESIADAITAALAPVNETLRALANQRPGLDFDGLLNKLPILLAGFAQAKQLFAPAMPTANPMDPMAGLMQFAKIKEVMDSLGMTDAKPSGAATAMTMFKEFGKPLLDALQAGQAQRPRAAPQAARPSLNPRVVAMPGVTIPSATHAPGFPATVISTAIPDDMMPAITLLASAARSGETPESVADRLLNFLTEDQANNIADVLEDGTMISVLKARAEFAGQGFWLDSVAKAFLEGLVSEPETGDDDVLQAGGETAATDDNDGDS